MPARDFIKVSVVQATAPHSAMLRQYINAVRNAYDLAKRVQGIMEHNHDGVNYGDLEAMFGLPTGAGPTVVALVNGAIRDVDARALTERVG